MKSIENIERNAELLMQLDCDKSDQVITSTEFEKVGDNSKLVAGLTGNKGKYTWTKFKEKFIDYQFNLGFKWTRTRGRGGPVNLEEIVLPSEVGAELAEHEFKNKSKSGRFDELVSEALPKLHKYLGRNYYTFLDISHAREGFKSYSTKNQSYKFLRGRGSKNYELSIQEYRYQGAKSKQREYQLGKIIKGELKKLLDLDFLDHTQKTRDGRKLENADFEGFRIQRHLEGDRFLMYSFELKPTNAVRAVSDAISQAVNYRSRSHFTYIVIPMFDQTSFHDSDRLEDFIDMCKTNQIGIISINLNVDIHELNDLTLTLSAPETIMADSERLSLLVKGAKMEMCPLCRSIVGSNRSRCGWLVEAGQETHCMKELMEHQMLERNNR